MLGQMRMPHLRLVLLAVGLLSVYALATISEDSRLFWSADRPLTWQDFQGTPPSGISGKEAAKIWLVLECSGNWEIFWDKSARVWVAQITGFVVRAYMDRTKSWVLPGRQTPERLLHEQLHFDLLEVFRRVLEIRLSALVGFRLRAACPKQAEEGVRRLFAEIYEEVAKKHQETQDRYDKETAYGRNLQKQKEWQKMIHMWLADPQRAFVACFTP